MEAVGLVLCSAVRINSFLPLLPAELFTDSTTLETVYSPPSGGRENFSVNSALSKAYAKNIEAQDQAATNSIWKSLGRLPRGGDIKTGNSG